MNWVLTTLRSLLPGFRMFATSTQNKVDDAICTILEAALADNGNNAVAIVAAMKERGFVKPEQRVMSATAPQGIKGDPG